VDSFSCGKLILLIADYHLDNDVNGVDVVADINARAGGHAHYRCCLITANYSTRS